MTSATNDKAFWDHYAEIYDILLVLKAYRTLMADMLRVADIKPGISVADFGCGSGNFLRGLFQMFGSTVKGFGFDRSQAMLKHAQKKLLDSEYSLEQLDLSAEVDLGLRFDRILCSQVLYTLPDPEAAIRMLKSHLNPEGRMVIVNPDSEQFMGLILMAQLETTPADVGRWRTNDLAKLHALAYELFGEISVAEIGRKIRERYIVPALYRFGTTPVRDILSELGKINVEIVRRAQEKGTYHFTSNRVLEKYVVETGFSILHASRTYGEQCHLIVAQPTRQEATNV